MINTFKNHHFLAVISSMLMAMLLWTGLSLVPSYADSSHTYYAFAMYKSKEGTWRKLTKPEKKLPVGSYLFQIVYIRPDEDGLPWIALRGEFKFVEATEGGVKVLSRHTLAEKSPTNGDINNSLWDDKHSDGNKHWINAGRKYVQPLIARMDGIVKGNSDPNFMRFLVRQPNKKESWKVSGKDYHLYRLHYIDTNSVYQYKEALSRFINPKENPTSLVQLKEWINDQSDFGMAKYLGKADDAHKEFYGHFKDWFNQKVGADNKPSANNAQDNTGDGTENTSEESSPYSDLFLILIITIIVLIAVFWVYKQSDSDRKPSSSRHRDLDSFEETNSTETTIISQETNLRNRRKNVNMHQTLTPPQYTQEHSNVLENTQPKIGKDKAVSQILSSPEFRSILSEEGQKFLQKYMLQNIKEIVKKQVRASTFDDIKFMSTLTTRVDLRVDKRIEEQQSNVVPSTPTQRATSSSGGREHTHQPQQTQQQKKEVISHTEIDKKSRQPVSTANEVTEQLKNIFVSMKSIDDEIGLNALGVNVAPCDFVIQVVGNYLKLNQPMAYYERLDKAIQTLTEHKVSLIIPNVGDDVDSAEHNALSQQTVTKGKLNVVASLARPGVKCDDAIRRKAEVVQNI